MFWEILCCKKWTPQLYQSSRFSCKLNQVKYSVSFFFSFLHMCMYVYAYKYMYMYVYVYIYMYAPMEFEVKSFRSC